MHEFSEYNQIKMYFEDEKHTSFRTPLGVYCYTVMPFGLKNTGATYQWAMNMILHEHIRKIVDCYVDDIIVKSRDKGDYLADMKMKSIHLADLKMYPKNEKHTSFRMPLGVYCYTMMPFGLKNAEATYERAMNKIFHRHIRKTM